VDTQETDLDERMHTTPWFHATDIPNVPPKNLVQIGIGGWQDRGRESRSNGKAARPS
jgi:agmatinase